MKLIFFGPPGAGKGVLCDLVHQATDLPHISVGAMLREHMEKHDEIGEKVKADMDAGHLVDDDLSDEMLKERIAQDDCKNGFLLDGYPRDVYQAKFITELVDIDGVVYVDIPENVIIERIMKRAQTEHRSDDTPEVIRERLKLFHETTEPVVEFFFSKGIPVLKVSGEYDIETEADIKIQRIINWYNDHKKK